ncbi:aldo/keto reductase [Nocardiopsis sp. EMB25]|uniref:aldo/keto reductase n=1 Tax=Nocardiopsis TaxID=2013 RepID=UPI00034A18B4|nr:MULTISPECIES: aldo/keto reductase [Nocardiopsis]MCY9783060.1 aldo/keto reductase [Nocardiopsis sp. EMB25]
MIYVAAPARYDTMPRRRCGRSGLYLPVLSLGLWHGFGEDRGFEAQRAVLLRAFDLGVTHFDVAGTQGPPVGAAEETLGRVLTRELRRYRDEVVVTTKAGGSAWRGPYGGGGSRKAVLAGLDRSLTRLGLDHVDVFHHDHPDPDTPLEETMGALDTAVRRGKALYAGVSGYSPELTRRASGILRRLGTPMLVHQTPYSMFDRRAEDGLLEVLDDLGTGCVADAPLARGLLSHRHLRSAPEDSRPDEARPLPSGEPITENVWERVRALEGVAGRRGQTLAQMALAWVLRDERVTSAVVGATGVAQLEDDVAAVGALDLTDAELAEIEPHARAD